MPFGYTGQNLPNQTKANSGVFSISEVADLEKQGKFGGSLELIEEQTASGVTNIDFTSIQENKYDVLYLQWTATGGSSLGDSDIRLSNNSGSSFIASGYQEAWQYGYSTGQFAEVRSTSATQMRITADVRSTGYSGGYVYFYNLGNSSKYSFITFQSFSDLNISGFGDGFAFGGGVLPTAEIHNAIRISLYAGGGGVNATAKLYGVKQI